MSAGRRTTPLALPAGRSGPVQPGQPPPELLAPKEPPTGHHPRHRRHVPDVVERVRVEQDEVGRQAGADGAEVVAADRKGLLASLAAAIAETDVDLRGANVATFGEKAVDVFFLTDERGEKLDEPRTVEVIEALRLAADLQPEDAAA